MQNPYKRARDEADSSVDGVPAKRVLAENDEDPQTIGPRILPYWNLDLSQCLHVQSDSDMEIAPDDIDLPMTDAIASPRRTENICYGALCNAKAQAESTERMTIQDLPWCRFHTLKVVLRGDHYYLSQVGHATTEDFAVLDLVTTADLHSLTKFSDLSFTAVVSSSWLSKTPRKATRKKTIIDITVNVMGPENLADDVGEALAAASGYFQHPVFLEAGIPYVNPHYFYPGNQKSDLRHLIGPAKVDSRAIRVCEGIENALESLDNPPSLPVSMEGKEVSLVANQCLIDTQLKSHQIDGVKFILNREDPNFCHSVNSDLLCLINSSLQAQRPTLCLGGVLADIMGLGKTLTVLSAIVYSKQVAMEFASTNGSKSNSPRLMKATLVVLPSRQVLDVWNAEIKERFQLQTLEVYDFHGESRAKSCEAFTEHDIVLTTYHTLAADWKRHRVLQDIRWFRVVLDEAHWIRNQSTRIFKAAESLQAERRWCLTGTPIQNSLDDLRSLLKFLRFEPFSSSKFFEQHIVEPLRTEYDDSFRNLKLLLRVICLRRTGAYLNLPPSITEVVPVVLTPTETAMYEGILAECQAEFDRIASTNSDLKRHSVLFATIMKLRRLCNHGTFSPAMARPRSPTPSGKRSKSKKLQSNIAGDTFCEFCSASDEDTSASLDGLHACPVCGRWLADSEASSFQDWTIKPLTPSSSSLIVRESSSGASTPRSLSVAPPSPSPFGLPDGHSSKLLAVTDSIQKSCLEMDSKSIVFTSWRSTLDILTKMLYARSIPSLRIDGRVPFADRSVLLSKFRDDPTIPVLLMSIDTGSVGLTLTNANRVHIVEPQWNPSVEAQAIARALRMGQTRTVTVVKYVTEKTVEQNIVTLQQMKSRLAKFSLESTTDENATGSLDDLKFVLDTTV